MNRGAEGSLALAMAASTAAADSGRAIHSRRRGGVRAYRYDGRCPIVFLILIFFSKNLEEEELSFFSNTHEVQADQTALEEGSATRRAGGEGTK